MSDLSYVYAVARIRVKEKSLLSDQDIQKMVSMSDPEQVLRYLREKGWGEAGKETGFDAMAETEREKTSALMKELGIEPGVFEVLDLPQLFHNLKTAIKEVLSQTSNPGAYYQHEKFGGEKMKNILLKKDFDALPEFMRETAKKAYQVMTESGDGQRCDCVVDRGTLAAMTEQGRRSGSKLLEQYTQMLAAVSDIKIAVRALKTGKSKAFLTDALAPCGSFDVKDLANATVSGEESFYSYLENHGFKEAAGELRVSPASFEKWCDDRIMETIRPQKANPFSMDPVVAYYLARENEIRTVRILYTAKSNGFSEEETRERVRKMYV